MIKVLVRYLWLLKCSIIGGGCFPVFAAITSVGQVLHVVDGGYYTSTLTVTGLSLPTYTYVGGAPAYVTQSWEYNTANQNLYYVLHPNTTYLWAGNISGIQFASWSTRVHTTIQSNAAPIPYDGSNNGQTWVLAPDWTHIMHNGSAGLPYGGCGANVAWTSCLSWSQTSTLGLVNHWYWVLNLTSPGASRTFWSEQFRFNGVTASGRPGITVQRIDKLKTLHLRTEDSIDFGAILQTGHATATAWRNHTMSPTLDNVVTNTFPTGVAKFQMTKISGAGCGEAEFSLNGGGGGGLTDGTWYDLVNLNSPLGIRWVSPGNCSPGSETITKRFTVQYN